jgi:transposase
MTRFIEGECRTQATLLPELLDDYIAESNPVRVIDVFTDELHLQSLGFKTEPEDTGRPAYHPATMLKIYIYGYLNRIQSSRRLEREAQRNVELMWLTGRLSPDFKTIADFRKNNGKAIQKVCREFVLICRKLDLFSDAFVAIDGSKFKAVNNRDRNFSKSKLKRRLEIIDESIARYLGQLESADRQDSKNTADISGRLHDKIAKLKQEIKQLKKIEKKMLNTPDQQISLTDPDARSMSCRGTGVVGYNVQTAVDTKHHIIVTHEVTNVGNDKSALNHMATCAKDAIGKDTLEVVADRGYYSGIEIVKCEDVQIATYVPKAQTSGNIKKGLFSKRDFKWIAKDKEYECPAGERMIWRLSTENVEKYLVSTGVLIAQHVG